MSSQEEGNFKKLVKASRKRDGFDRHLVQFLLEEETTVMAGGAPTVDALEARNQTERLQADRVWVQEGTQEPWSPRIVERRVAAATRERARSGRHSNAPGQISWEIVNFIPLQMHRRTNVRLERTSI